MIELSIILFVVSFSIPFGWVLGKRMGDLIAIQVEVRWDKTMDFLKRIPQLFRFIPILIQNVWYWKFRQPKLVKAMQQTGDHNKRVWALAERLKNSDRGRTRSEE